VRACISGAAALPVDTFKGFEKKFRIPLLEGYGLTEASPVVTLNPLKGIKKAGSIGVALSKNIALKIVDDKDVQVGPDETGEQNKSQSRPLRRSVRSAPVTPRG